MLVHEPPVLALSAIEVARTEPLVLVEPWTTAQLPILAAASVVLTVLVYFVAEVTVIVRVLEVPDVDVEEPDRDGTVELSLIVDPETFVTLPNAIPPKVPEPDAPPDRPGPPPAAPDGRVPDGIPDGALPDGKLPEGMRPDCPPPAPPTMVQLPLFAAVMRIVVALIADVDDVDDADDADDDAEVAVMQEPTVTADSFEDFSVVNVVLPV